ncbi:primosomal protein N' [Peptoniphilus sp.]|jgi:primosomal protein N' (replication factor Y)|uniref:primosomal protein N' n=1 Tax=Peptoniphilus sp. TaxID=1971214 RepID=UPI003D947EC9
MFVDIFIENNFHKIDTLYTYLAKESDDVDVGKRVLVSFGNGYRVGIVLSISDTYNGEYRDKLKRIERVLDDEPIISKELIDLGVWMKDRYLVGYSKAFSPILPPGNLQKIKKKIKIIKYPYGEDLKRLNEINLETLYEDLNEDDRKFISKLRKNGFVSYEYLPIVEVKPFMINFLKVSDDIDMNALAQLTEKQRNVFNFISEKNEVSRKDVMQKLQISQSPIKSLIDKGLIVEYKKEITRTPKSARTNSVIHRLNQEQLRAYNEIISSKKEVSLLYGLTGSGKTEVYIHLVKKIIEDGGDAIVLVPEIGLTPQMIDRFKGRFDGKVAIIHSKLSAGERYDEYRKILNGEVKIVVGVRSAVFAPFKNLKMIIVDESHDSSYDLHDGLKYDTIEVAKRRIKDKGKLILGSATPSVESYYYAKEGKYNLLKLMNRATKGSVMPKTQIVDMRDELLSGNISIFSKDLQEAMKEKLSKNEQIILFLNRRGFSNFISCRSCGEVIKCENCDISMTYHKPINRLICHYCGSTKPVPKVCPSCGSKFIKQFGIGTQRVEEEVQKLFPYARVIRMDRDTTSKKDSYNNFYKKIKDGEADVIVGTQMISKGFDFENVTLVGIIAADLSMYVSDYKATENTFQLITQVSGRAGRASKKGEVIIQTYNPTSEVIKYSADGNFEDFFEYELSERKLFEYPPFAKLIDVEIASVNENLSYKWADYFLNLLAKNTNDFEIKVTKLIKMPKIKNMFKTKFSVKVSPSELNLLIEVINRVIIDSKILNEDKVFLNIDS